MMTDLSSPKEIRSNNIFEDIYNSMQVNLPAVKNFMDEAASREDRIKMFKDELRGNIMLDDLPSTERKRDRKGKNFFRKSNFSPLRKIILNKSKNNSPLNNFKLDAANEDCNASKKAQINEIKSVILNNHNNMNSPPNQHIKFILEEVDKQKNNSLNPDLDKINKIEFRQRNTSKKASLSQSSSVAVLTKIDPKYKSILKENQFKENDERQASIPKLRVFPPEDDRPNVLSLTKTNKNFKKMNSTIKTNNLNSVASTKDLSSRMGETQNFTLGRTQNILKKVNNAKSKTVDKIEINKLAKSSSTKEGNRLSILSVEGEDGNCRKRGSSIITEKLMHNYINNFHPNPILEDEDFNKVNFLPNINSGNELIGKTQRNLYELGIINDDKSQLHKLIYDNEDLGNLISTHRGGIMINDNQEVQIFLEQLKEKTEKARNYRYALIPKQKFERFIKTGTTLHNVYDKCSKEVKFAEEIDKILNQERTRIIANSKQEYEDKLLKLQKEQDMLLAEDGNLNEEEQDKVFIYNPQAQKHRKIDLVMSISDRMAYENRDFFINKMGYNYLKDPEFIFREEMNKNLKLKEMKSNIDVKRRNKERRRHSKIEAFLEDANKGKDYLISRIKNTINKINYSREGNFELEENYPINYKTGRKNSMPTNKNLDGYSSPAKKHVSKSSSMKKLL
jgi:hypothetical protein